MILLAPMEGLLDHILRDVLTRVGGVDRCVSEFIRVTDQLLPKRLVALKVTGGLPKISDSTLKVSMALTNVSVVSVGPAFCAPRMNMSMMM